jgi:SAM-dependent methyltransferase
MDTNSARPDCVFCEKELTIVVLKNILKNGHSYDLYECGTCEIATLHPFPSEEELSKLYSCGNYRTGAGKRFVILIELLVYLERIRKRRRISQLVKPGKILDIGCGRGLFLEVMRRGGWKTIGTELNEQTASYFIKSYDSKILTGDIIQHKLPAESLDVININQVLEHLKTPTQQRSCKHNDSGSYSDLSFER